MKKIKLLVVFTVLFLMVTGVLAESEKEKKKDPAKWQVNIEIQYNAISKEEATLIINKTMRQNETACTAKATTKKVDNSDTIRVIDGFYGYQAIDNSN